MKWVCDFWLHTLCYCPQNASKDGLMLVEESRACCSIVYRSKTHLKLVSQNSLIYCIHPVHGSIFVKFQNIGGSYVKTRYHKMWRDVIYCKSPRVLFHWRFQLSKPIFKCYKAVYYCCNLRHQFVAIFDMTDAIGILSLCFFCFVFLFFLRTEILKFDALTHHLRSCSSIR